MATKNILEIFNLDDANVNLDLNSKKESEFYNPKPEGKETYTATVRILPIPVNENGEIVGVEAEPFYMKKRYYLRDVDNTGYYFDSPATIGERCPISGAYFRLKNSQNVLDKKRAEELKLNTHFWSLVLIVDDKKHPELNGKIKIFRYTSELQDKIKIEWEKRKVKVWDPFNGKDFDLTITNKRVALPSGEVRDFSDYTKCEFLEKSPLVYKGKAFDKTDKNVGTLITELYKSCPNIGEYKYKAWTEEEKVLLNKILDRYKTKEDDSDVEQSITASKMGNTKTKSVATESYDVDEAEEIMKTLDL